MEFVRNATQHLVNYYCTKRCSIIKKYNKSQHTHTADKRNITVNKTYIPQKSGTTKKQIIIIRKWKKKRNKL
jgi:hypothetical protein